MAHAALVTAGGTTTWPVLPVTAVAALAGLFTRGMAGAASGVVVALALVPVWPALTSIWGPDIHFDHALPWLAFVGAVLARPVAPHGWHVSGPWLWALAAWAVVLALVGPLVAVRELDFTVASIGAPTANGAGGATPPAAAGTVVLSVTAQLVSLVLFDWYCGASPALRRRAWWAMAPGAAAAAIVALWQQSVDASLLGNEPWMSLDRAAGTFFDANATGAFLALTVPLVAGLWHPTRLWGLSWQVLWWGLGLAGVLATGSRSALVTWALILGLQLVVRGRWWQRAVVGGTAVLAAVGLLALPVSDPSTGHAVGRLAGTVRTLVASGASGIEELVWYRNGYGPVAAAIVREHPWVGTGPGTFAGLAVDYSPEVIGVRLPADNAQNWWRQQVAELGFAGALPALAASGLALLALWRARRSHEAALAAAPLAGLGLLSLMSPPMAHPLLQATAALVVAHAVVAWAALPPAPATSRGATVWLLALACATGTAMAGWGDLRPPARAARFHFPYAHGVDLEGPTPYGRGRWMGTDAIAVLAPEGPTLVTRVVVPHGDAAARPVRIRVESEHAVACVRDAVDATPFECRMRVPAARWPLVRISISRPWLDPAGTSRGAVVSARFED